MACKCRYLQQLKTFVQNKITNKEMLPFLIHHITYFLFWFLTHFVTTQLNYLQCVFNCIIKKIPISRSLHLLKIANPILFSVFCFSFLPNLLFQCGDIEKNQVSAIVIYMGLELMTISKSFWYKLTFPIKHLPARDFSKFFYIKWWS